MKIHEMLPVILSLVACLVAWHGTGRVVAAARFIDYLYVEANEGDSSGGHVALRFDRHTFHFQHENPGIIRIQRIDASAFDYMYARLGNRTIRESRMAVSDETYDVLQDAMLDLLMIQDAHVAVRDDSRRDADLFEMLLRRRSGDRSAGETRLPIRGAAYLLDDFPEHGGHEAGEYSLGRLSSHLVALRERIRATYGARFIEERLSRIESRLREASLHANEAPLPPLTENSLPHRPPSAAIRNENALLELFALKTLLAAPSLRAGTIWTSDDELFRLTAEEKSVLQAFAKRQEERLVKLVNSERSDWGFSFLMGMTRLSVVNAALKSGGFVFPDIFPPAKNGHEGKGVSDAFEHLPPDYLPVVARERRELFRLRRAEFFKGGAPGEADFSTLERAGNLLLDIESAIAREGQPRKPPNEAFPSRDALRADLILPEMDEAALVRELESARIAERKYSEELVRLYAYNLVRRNCVTELFTLVNRALGRHALAGVATSNSAGSDPDQAAVKESNERLGGFITPWRGLNFIPFIAAYEVEARYRVVSHNERLSYRRQRLEEMKKLESRLMVFLRESNTVTSTIHRFTPGDSIFLFFTDDTFVTRPLFGAFNLLAGAGQALFGCAALPFQGSSQLVSGVRGVIFSLPELIFINIRKGSMAWMQ